MGKKKGKSQPIGTKNDAVSPAVAVVAEMKDPSQLKAQQPVTKPAPTPAKAEGKKKSAPPPPEPVVEEVSNDEPKKKKTTRGGKRNPNRRLRLAEEAAALAAEQAANVNDPSEEQQGHLDAFEKKLEEVKGQSKGELTSAADGRKIRGEIDRCLRDIDDKLALYKRSKPRCARSGALTRDLENMDPNEHPEMYAQVKADRAAAIEWEQLTAFKEACTEIKEKLQTVRQGMEANKAQEAKVTLLTKIAKFKKVSFDEIAARDDITTRTLDLSADVMAHLFNPTNLSRKFQDQFGAIIDLPGGKGRGKGGDSGGGVGRQVEILGYANEVRQTVDFLKKLDFSGQKTVSYDRNIVSMVVGQKGARRRELEEEFSIYIITVGNTITGLGNMPNVKAFYEKVDGMVSEKKAEREEKIVKLPIDATMVSRFLEKVNRFQTDGVRVNVDKEAKPKPEIVVRGRNAEAVDVAFDKIKKMVKGYVHHFVAVPSENLEKLMAGKGRGRGRRGGKNDKKDGDKKDGDKKKDEPVNRLAQDFDAICRNYGVHISKHGDKSGLNLVGDHKDDIHQVKEMIETLSTKCGYDTETVQLNKYQHRVFQAEDAGNVHFVHTRSGAHDVAIRRNRALDWHLQITGTAEQITAAKERINEVLEREGQTETIEVPDALIPRLLGRGAQGIRDLEEYHVAVFVDKTALTVTLVGGTGCVSDAKKALQREVKSVANQVTKEITFEEGQSQKLIGARGATARRMRESSGANINIDDKTLTVKITGNKGAVDRAVKLVNNILSGKEEEETPAAADTEVAASAEPSGARDKKASKPKKKTQSKVDISSQDHFPALGGGAPKVPKKKNSASSTSKGKAWGATEEDAEQTPVEEVSEEKEPPTPLQSPMKGEVVDSAEEMEAEYTEDKEEEGKEEEKA